MNGFVLLKFEILQRGKCLDEVFQSTRENTIETR